MQFPPQITFLHLQPSEAVRAHAAQLVDKLEQFHDHIISCRVVIEAPSHHHHKGQIYRIGINLKIPGREIAVNRLPKQPHQSEDVYRALDEAFRSATRKLEGAGRRDHGKVKHHESEAHGRILRLFPEQSYGLIESTEDGEVYFHANAVLNGAFPHLAVGREVRYVAQAGEKGLQASVVKPVGKHHLVP